MAKVATRLSDVAHYLLAISVRRGMVEREYQATKTAAFTPLEHTVTHT